MPLDNRLFRSPSGSGRCNPGFYCPPGSILPVPTDPGFYSGQPGAIVQIMCPPGYFASLKQLSKCSDCPAGFKCPNFGMSRPIVCQRGYYRSKNDAITCRACPPGSWSPARALPDKNMCLPCPAGTDFSSFLTSILSLSIFLSHLPLVSPCSQAACVVKTVW